MGINGNKEAYKAGKEAIVMPGWPTLDCLIQISPQSLEGLKTLEG